MSLLIALMLGILRGKKVRLSTGDKLMELFTTHPNMLKGIEQLSTLAV